MTVFRPLSPATHRLAAARRSHALEWALVWLYAVVTIGSFINARSLWIDEAMSLAIASQPYHVIAGIVQHLDAVHAFYYAILHLWMVFGHSAIVMRSLSAIFALATLPIVAALARAMFGDEAGPAAAAVLATSVFFIFHAQDARSVSLTLLVSAGASLAFFRAVHGGRLVDFVLLGFGAIVLIYTNVLAMFFLGALLLSLGVMQPSRRRIVAFIVVAAVVVLACIPLAVLIRMNSAAQIDWIARSSASETVHFVLSILGGDGGIGQVGFLTGVVEAWIVLGLMAFGVAANLRQLDRSHAVALSIWFVVPLAAGILCDRFAHPILVARYFSFELVPAAVLAGAGLVTIRRRFTLIVPRALIGFLATATFINVMTMQREDWRAAAAFLTRQSQPGDVVVVWKPQLVLPLEFALREDGRYAPAPIVFPRRTFTDVVTLGDQRPDAAAVVKTSPRRVWLVASNTKSRGIEPGPFAQLTRSYPRVSQQFFAGVAVIRYSR